MLAVPFPSIDKQCRRHGYEDDVEQRVTCAALWRVGPRFLPALAAAFYPMARRAFAASDIPTAMMINVVDNLPLCAPHRATLFFGDSDISDDSAAANETAFVNSRTIMVAECSRARAGRPRTLR